MRCKLRSLAWRGRRADIMQTKEAAWSGQASFRPEQLNPARLCSNTILAGDESNATACRQLNTDGRIRRAHKTLLSLRRSFSPTKCQSGCCGSRARIDLWANVIKLTITLLDIGASNMSSQLFSRNFAAFKIGQHIRNWLLKKDDMPEHLEDRPRCKSIHIGRQSPVAHSHIVISWPLPDPVPGEHKLTTADPTDLGRDLLPRHGEHIHVD